MTTPDAEKIDRAEVAALEALAEKAYDEMYDSRSPAGCYSDLKDYFRDAISAAERAGLTEDAADGAPVGPLYPSKRTFSCGRYMFALCQKRKCRPTD